MKTHHKDRLDAGEYLQPDELVAFIEWHRREYKRKGRHLAAHKTLMMAEILCLSGLRSSELCGLRICDVPPCRHDNTIWVEKGKGSKDRIVDIPAELAQGIAEYVKRARLDVDETEPLFATREGRAYCYREIWARVQRWFRDWNRYRDDKYCREVVKGLCAINPPRKVRLGTHSLRHSYAIRFLDVNGDNDRALMALATQLGHSDIKTTQIYAKTAYRRRREFADRMAV